MRAPMDPDPSLLMTLAPAGAQTEHVVVWLAVVGALLAAGLFATLRAALEQCSPLHVLEEVAKGKLLTPVQTERRARLEAILRESPRLTTTAGVLEAVALLAFVALLLHAVGFPGASADGAGLLTALTLAVAVPFVLVFTRLLPGAIVRAHGEALLAAGLPTFMAAAWLLYPIAWPLDAMRRAIQRVFGLEEVGAATRILVEDFRDVIEETGLEQALPESGLELIENVMDFHDVDVAAVMTPRTEIEALDVGAGVGALFDLMNASSRSRIPLFEETIDSVVGWVSARDVVRATQAGPLEEISLRELARPVKFVPETKQIPELLEEFRRERFKLAIVLDEYGGTAGLVTLGDVMTELVGKIHDEYDVGNEAPTIVPLGPALYAVQGAEHVSDVNEALGLELPEEDDYETLAGFLLARLGRFPGVGETIAIEGSSYTIAEATDRRILLVHVQVAA